MTVVANLHHTSNYINFMCSNHNNFLNLIKNLLESKNTSHFFFIYENSGVKELIWYSSSLLELDKREKKIFFYFLLSCVKQKNSVFIVKQTIKLSI